MHGHAGGGPYSWPIRVTANPCRVLSNAPSRSSIRTDIRILFKRAQTMSNRSAGGSARSHSGAGGLFVAGRARHAGLQLDRYPDDLERALIEWLRTLRPFIDACQQFGVRKRFFFTLHNRVELLFRQWMARLRQMPFTRRLFALIAEGSKAGKLKDQDIAGDLMFRQATTDEFAKGAGNATRSTIGTSHR